MGKVYLGRDPGLEREVAVKTIRLGSAFGVEATARFAMPLCVARTQEMPIAEGAEVAEARRGKKNK